MEWGLVGMANKIIALHIQYPKLSHINILALEY